jgi:hypothetical protein
MRNISRSDDADYIDTRMTAIGYDIYRPGFQA